MSPSYFEQGFSVREPAWHGLAIVLDTYPGRDEAMRLAGHDFQVVERQLQTVVPSDKPYYTVELPGGRREQRKRQPQPIDTHKAVLRADTGDCLGVVGKDYGVVQNSVPWDIIDELATSGEIEGQQIQYETGGIANGLHWVMVRVGQEYHVVPGDPSPVQSYLSAGWAHDGTSAIRFDNHDLRKICWNTIQAANAQAERSGRTISLRHTKNVMSRVDEIRQAVLGASRSAQAFRDLAAELAAVDFDEDSVRDFLRRFIPDPPAAVQTSRSATFVAKARGQVQEILAGPTVPREHKFTGYGLWSAGVEYLDHGRTARNPSTYFLRTVRPEPAKAALAKLILSPPDPDDVLADEPSLN